MDTTEADPASGQTAGLFDDRDDAIEAALNVAEFNRSSVYNVAGYRPVRSELSHAPITVTGQLPTDLEGVYLRNGTNVQFDPTHIRLHAFAGAGMLHQVQIRDGAATYSNAYIRTPRFEIEHHAGREVYPDFSDIAGGGTAAIDKTALVTERVEKGLLPDLTTFELTPGSTSIRHHHGKLYCLQETGYAFVLDTDVSDGRLTIDGTGRIETWQGEWEGPFSAHPRVQPITGDVYNLSIQPSGAIIAGLIRRGQLVRQSTVNDASTDRMGWLHDFFLTENYLIFPDISVRLHPERLMQPDGSVFRFNDTYPMRWGVLPRQFDESTVVRWFETDRPATVWHVINAWERHDEEGAAEIALYSPAFPSYPADVPIHTPEEPPAQVWSWVLNLETNEISSQTLLIDHGYERPSLNLDYVGKPSRYCYLLDEHGDGYMGKGVLKYDLFEEAGAGYLDYGEMYGGEALFIPRPSSSAEDDGYLVDLLMDDHSAELIIIDARTMTELARLHLPQRVPFGVHACWLNPQEIEGLTS